MNIQTRLGLVRIGFIVALLVAMSSVVVLAQNIQSSASTGTTAVTSTAIQTLVAPVAGKTVLVFRAGVVIGTGGTTGQTVQFISCTATGCPGGTTAVSEIFSATGGTQIGPVSPVFALQPGAGLFTQATATVAYSASATVSQQ